MWDKTQFVLLWAGDHEDKLWSAPYWFPGALTGYQCTMRKVWRSSWWCPTTSQLQARTIQTPEKPRLLWAHLCSQFHQWALTLMKSCFPNGYAREHITKSDPVTLTHSNIHNHVKRFSLTLHPQPHGKLWQTPRQINPCTSFSRFPVPKAQESFLDEIKPWGAAAVLEQSGHTHSQYHSNAEQWQCFPFTMIFYSYLNFSSYLGSQDSKTQRPDNEHPVYQCQVQIWNTAVPDSSSCVHTPPVCSWALQGIYSDC